MLIRLVISLFGTTAVFPATGQAIERRVDSFTIYSDIKITIDYPQTIKSKSQTIVCFYALPNGNTTAQTMGKKMSPGDDWHFDIQHIAAQTSFVRKQLKEKNFIVVYLENKLKSWPAWKQQNNNYSILLPKLVDSIYKIMPGHSKRMYLNGHSGGGSFIFGYLSGVEKIPGFIERISFIDSNYGYDSSYYPKLKQWLLENKNTHLSVFAYNDSIALYNGKPIVSPTGGTWYRSRLMLSHLMKDFHFHYAESDSFYVYTHPRIILCLKKNIDRGIYHTQQVELNGFIHSVLLGTKYSHRRYKYYGVRAYENLIE